jgi:hypothetical protein
VCIYREAILLLETPTLVFHLAVGVGEVPDLAVKAKLDLACVS